MYQIMALAAIVYIALMLVVFPETRAPAISLEAGLDALWSPGMILFVQGIWILSFLHAGRSSVTDSRIAFHVVEENI